MSATKTTILATLVLVLTFSGGFVAGFAVHRAIRSRAPHASARAMARHLDFRLGLTDEQRVKVEAILQRRHVRMQERWDSVRPEVRAEIEAANAEIAAVLTPEQRAKFERMKLHLGRPRGRARTEPTR